MNFRQSVKSGMPMPKQKRSSSVFATGKVRYIRRIIAAFGKVSIKQFFFKFDSCACAVFIFEPRSGDERK